MTNIKESWIKVAVLISNLPTESDVDEQLVKYIKEYVKQEKAQSNKELLDEIIEKFPKTIETDSTEPQVIHFNAGQNAALKTVHRLLLDIRGKL